MRSCLAGNGAQGQHAVAFTSGEARNLERSCKTSSEIILSGQAFMQHWQALQAAPAATQHGC